MSERSRHEPRRRARRRALQAIYQWQITGQQAGDIQRQFLAAQDFRNVDADYFELLLHGVVTAGEDLDSALQPFLDRPLGQVDLMERVVLRIGAFERLHSPELPGRVVINECVDLAHRFGSTGGHSYVNAVLDQAARAWRGDEMDRSAAEG